MSLQELLDLVPELRMRWYNAAEGEDLTDPDEVEDFHLSDYGWSFDPEVKAWWERTTGTRYLGHGNYRFVVSLGDGTVAKLALDGWGEDENQREIEAWQRHQGTEVEGFLAPMVRGSEEVVVMEQAHALSSDQLEANPALARAHEARDHAFNLLGHQGKHRITDTAAPGNWGVLHGQVVLIDYPEEP